MSSKGLISGFKGFGKEIIKGQAKVLKGDLTGFGDIFASTVTAPKAFAEGVIGKTEKDEKKKRAKQSALLQAAAGAQEEGLGGEEVDEETKRQAELKRRARSGVLGRPGGASIERVRLLGE